MKDRFKFRAWNNKTKQMIYQEDRKYYADNMHAFNMSPDGSYWNFWKDCYGERVVDADVFDSVLMQCTGLKDSNGKLIYEGDIVQTIDKMFMQTVDFSHGEMDNCFGHECGFSFHYDPGAMQVVGNIHENPELLEVGG